MEKRIAIKWELHEIINLKRLYNTVSIKTLSKEFKRSEMAIYLKAYELGLKRRKLVKREKLTQCFVYVKKKHKLEAMTLINQTIKKWK